MTTRTLLEVLEDADEVLSAGREQLVDDRIHVDH
jgi:hypothetical protein